ncbi:MAG TPA: acyl-CoA desaturase [Polyangiaceae bacterium]|nr:acyl-CoA desaturase [Polyangiaceae bacterium]
MSSLEVRVPVKPKRRSLLDASDAGPVSLHRRRGGNAELAALKETLRDAGIFSPVPGYYSRKLCEVLLLWGVSVAALLLFPRSLFVLGVGPLLALTTGQTVLLAHDVVHGAAFTSRNVWIAGLRRTLPHVLIGLFSGGSASWWKQSHNAHHVLSNDAERDPDIDYPFLAFDIEQARDKAAFFHPVLRNQHVLVWFMLPAVAITMRLYSVAFLLRRLTRPGHHRLRRALELVVLVAHWILYLGLMSTLPPLVAVAIVAMHQAGFAVYLALITASNHWAMPMPNAEQLSFVEHQVTTSRNIRGGALVQFFYGGLDAQIEHHLFTGLPRPRLLQARPFIRAFCQQRGIPYAEEGPVEAIKLVYQRLRSVAFEVRALDWACLEEVD